MIKIMKTSTWNKVNAYCDHLKKRLRFFQNNYKEIREELDKEQSMYRITYKRCNDALEENKRLHEVVKGITTENDTMLNLLNDLNSLIDEYGVFSIRERRKQIYEKYIEEHNKGNA